MEKGRGAGGGRQPVARNSITKLWHMGPIWALLTDPILMAAVLIQGTVAGVK